MTQSKFFVPLTVAAVIIALLYAGALVLNSLPHDTLGPAMFVVLGAAFFIGLCVVIVRGLVNE